MAKIDTRYLDWENINFYLDPTKDERLFTIQFDNKFNFDLLSLPDNSCLLIQYTQKNA